MTFKQLFLIFMGLLGWSFSTVAHPSDHEVKVPSGLLNEAADSIGNAQYIRPFLKKLSGLEADQRDKVRVFHIGDSHIQADFFSGEVRNLMQGTFGDGGWGASFPYRLSHTNGPSAVKYSSNIRWKGKRNSLRKPVQETGVSGHSIKSTSDFYQINLKLQDSLRHFDRLWVFAKPSDRAYDFKVGVAKAQAATEKKYIAAPTKVYHKVRSGDNLSSIAKKYGVRVSHLQQWNGMGRKTMIRAGQKLVVKNGDQPSAVSRLKSDDVVWAKVKAQHFGVGMQVFSWDSPQQACLLQGFKKNTQQQESVFTGFYLEDSQAKGIVYSMLGANGAQFRDYNRYPLFFEQLGQLPSDLYVLSMGTNECFDPSYTMVEYKDDMRHFIGQIRKYHPEASIILTTPADSYIGRGSKKRYNPRVKAVHDAMLQISNEQRVAYWDWWAVMGGENGIRAWKKAGYSRDYVHFSAGGYRIQARCFYQAMIRAYEQSGGELLLPPKGLDVKDVMPIDGQYLTPEFLQKIRKEQVAEDKGEAALFSLPNFDQVNWSAISSVFTYQKTRPLLFNSGLFLILFILFYAIYLKWEHIHSFRVIYVTIFSLFFYFKSSGIFFVLLIFSSIVDYYIGNKLYKVTDPKQRKLYLALSVIVNLGLLGYFKYTNFFIDSVNAIAGGHIAHANIFLPIGISFYTFQTMSYSIDLYRKSMKPAESFGDFMFFVTFFPQLVAGPIVRAADFIPQIRQKISLNKRQMTIALTLIIGGLIKKAIISDYISVNFVDRVFTQPTLYSGFENLMAVYGYAIQIYCDFSGYSDMAIGIALLMGFQLPENFRTPYNAFSLTEFWRRWHISLSSWLRDYLYIPLGGNKNGTVRTYINLMLTMILGGLWHGASWNFVLWGTMHGVVLAIERLVKTYWRLPSNAVTRSLGQLYTFHWVCLAWVFFRAGSFAQASTVISRIFTDTTWKQIPVVIMGYKEVFGLIILGYLTHLIPNRWENRFKHTLSIFPVWGRALTLAFVMWCVWQVTSSDVHPFIYFQF